ncbi:MAG: exosortase [Planctomycetota bacterium]|jgi:exosortase
MTPRRLGNKDLVGWLCLFALTGFLFRGALSGLFHRWWTDPTYSHGILVPAISLYFLLDRRKDLRGIAVGGSLWGVLALVAVIGIALAGKLVGALFLQATAFIAALAALALLVEGWAFLAATAFPIAYLLFMCPLPSGIYDPVSAQLRLFASSVSTVLLQVLGVAAARTGNIIHLANATLSVEDACSGIRSLFGITATATAFAFIIPGGRLRKTVFIVSALPIAVLSNILRVTGTGLLYQYAGARFAEGFYHSLEGWVFYALALAVLFLEYLLLNAAFPVRPPGARQASGEERQ